jgi:hypothetical protein
LETTQKEYLSLTNYKSQSDLEHRAYKKQKTEDFSPRFALNLELFLGNSYFEVTA